jgi:PTS system fructose-specific IIA component/PTS system nitrogen regulatory IIA component
MKIEDFLSENSVVYGLKSRDKEGALRELVAAMVEKGLISADLEADCLEALVLRENLGSTGTGRGVAFPHARLDEVSKLVGVFARSDNGVEFDAIDGEPVFLFFCLFSPKDESTEHVAALSRIAKIMRSPDWCRFLRSGKSAREIFELLLEAEEEYFG